MKMTLLRDGCFSRAAMPEWKMFFAVFNILVGIVFCLEVCDVYRPSLYDEMLKVVLNNLCRNNL